MICRHISIEGGSAALCAAIVRTVASSPKLRDVIIENPPSPATKPENLSLRDKQTIEDTIHHLSRVSRSIRLPVIPDNPPVYLHLVDDQEQDAAIYSMAHAVHELDAIETCAEDLAHTFRGMKSTLHLHQS